MGAQGNVYFCLHIHSNFWYAEYTHEQAIRQFIPLYSALLDVFESHQGGAACWDFDTQITLDILKESAPEIIQRLDKLAEKGLHDLIPCTWGTVLATHLTRSEFDLNFQESCKSIHTTFQNVAPTWMSQDGAYSPQFIPLVKQAGMEYYLLDQRILNRHYKNKVALINRFSPNLIDGQGETLPCLFFGLEGLNSYGDFANAVKSQLNKLKDIRQQFPEKNFLIYPFIDAERLDPPKLEKWLTEIEKLGVKYCCPHQFLKMEPNSNTRFEFDVGDWHDWSFHNDILADQRLWTAIERARDKLEEAHWWESQIRKHNISIDSRQQAKYKLMLEDATREIQISQGSDKTHWYASPHKMDIGLQYITSAYEKASYISGIYSYALAHAQTFLPNRPQSMKDTTLNLTILNPFKQISQYPMNFPVGIELPYIVTVNLNTPTSYRIQDYPQHKYSIETPTIFNILPGLSVHNLRTELFYQLTESLDYGKSCALQLVPSDFDREPDNTPHNSLENELIKIEFTSLGDIARIIDKRTGVIFEQNKNEDSKYESCNGYLPLFSPKFECQIVGAEIPENATLEVLSHEKDSPLSYIIERQSHENDHGHRLKLTTKYRIFPQFPGLMVDFIANIAGPLPGYYCPCEMDWSATLPSDFSITREVLSEVFTSSGIIPRKHQIFLNDWCIINNRKNKLGIAFDKRIHSCKQILFTPASSKNSEVTIPRFSIGFMHHFPEWVAQNLLSGVIHQRIWIVPFEQGTDITKNCEILQMLSKPPVLGWYL